MDKLWEKIEPPIPLSTSECFSQMMELKFVFDDEPNISTDKDGTKEGYPKTKISTMCNTPSSR